MPPSGNGRADSAAVDTTYRSVLDLLAAGRRGSARDLRSEANALGARRRAGDTSAGLLAEVLALSGEAVRQCSGRLPSEAALRGAVVAALGGASAVGDPDDRLLAAGLAAYWHALAGRGAHVVTLDDQRARAGAEVIGPFVANLGSTTGLVDSTAIDPERRIAYARDLTIAPCSELATDHLRDGLRRTRPDLVQRELPAAIVDDAHRVLVQPAVRTMHLEAPVLGSRKTTPEEAELAARLRRDVDYQVSLEHRAIRFAAVAVPELRRAVSWGEHASPAAVAAARSVERAILRQEGLRTGEDELVADISVQGFVALYESLGGLSPETPDPSAALERVYGLRTVGHRKSIWSRRRDVPLSDGPHPQFLAMERVVDRHRAGVGDLRARIRDAEPDARRSVLEMVDGWGTGGDASRDGLSEQLADAVERAVGQVYGAEALTSVPGILRNERLSILDERWGEHLRDLRFLQRHFSALYEAPSPSEAFAADADRLLDAARIAVRGEAVRFLERWLAELDSKG